MEYVPPSPTSNHGTGYKPELGRQSSAVAQTIQTNDHIPGIWQEDVSNCTLCHQKIGKLRRHHCRICLRCVCSSCSPSRVQLDGVAGVQRACRACIASAGRIPAMAKRLGHLSFHLSALCGDSIHRPASDAPTSIEDAAARCEASLMPLEEALAESRRRLKEAEYEAAAAGELIKRAIQGIKSLCSAQDAKDDENKEPILDALASAARRQPPSQQDLQEMGASLDAALADVSRALSGRGPTSSRSSSKRQTASSPICSITNGSSPGGDDEESQSLPMGRRSSIDTIEQQDMSKCSECNTKLGKRYLNPRHICRLCNRFVCSGCSPNMILLEGEKQPSRVCKPCVAETPHVAQLTRRAIDLGNRLASLSGADASRPEKCDRALDGGLAQAFNFCEGALAPLEETKQRR